MKTICSHMQRFDHRYRATQITKIVNDEVRMVER